MKLDDWTKLDGWDVTARTVRIIAGIGIFIDGMLRWDLTRMGVGLILIWSVTV